MARPVQIRTEFITVGAFLKWTQSVATGGEAKHLLASGQVRVNDVVEVRRGRQLRDGDRVRVGAEEFVVRYGA